MRQVAQRNTGNELDDELMTLFDQLTYALYEFDQAGIDSSNKNVEYEKARVKSLIQASGKNKEEREARAYTSEVAEADLAMQLAKHNTTVCGKKVDVLRQQLSALQTRYSSRKSESKGIHYGQL